MTRKDRWNRDTAVEKMAADFLDKHFYSIFTNKASVTRYSDTYHQFGGIDVSINMTNFDEKCKYAGCLNQVLEYVGIEVSILNKANTIQDGWFLNDALSTDYYAFIGLSATVDDDRQLSSADQISAADVLWVKKQDLLEYVQSFDGHYGRITLQQLKKDINQLRCDGDCNATDIFGSHTLDDKGKARWHYPHRKYWLTYSTNLDERPINIVIPRKTLESLPHSKHFIVTKEKVNKINN